jgi:plastocyanin
LTGAAALLLALPLLGGCGGSGTATTCGTGTTVRLNEFSFQPNSLKAKSGKTTLCLVDTGNVAHDIVITDSSGTTLAKSGLVQAGDTATFTFDLKPGTYPFYCDVPGHKASGMTGSLTVS